MKLTTAAVLAFAAASALANFCPYEENAAYARDLHQRDGGEGSLGSFDKRGGAIGSSLFKSLAAVAGTMSGRATRDSAQYGISRKISSSTHQTHSTPKHPRPQHRRRHQRQRSLQPPPQPPSLGERMMRRGLSASVPHLESLEKRKKGGKAPSLFKATAGAVGTMGGRVAGTVAQLGLLKAIIPPAPPPPLPIRRRALYPTPSRSSFSPLKAIKNAFSRTSQATARVYRKSAPARKKGKGALIAFMDGISDGATKKKS